MKDSLINTKLRIQKLEMQTGSLDDFLSSSGSANYEFEITNMTTEQLSALMGTAKKDGENNAEGQADGAPNNGLLGKMPLPDLNKK